MPTMRGQGSLDSFGTILSGLAKRLGLQSHLFELRLQQQWTELAGEPIASHTWPVHIRFKKLYLLVRNSIWLQQLTYLKPTLMAKLNEQAGGELVADIAFRVGEIPVRADSAPPVSMQTLSRSSLPLPDDAVQHLSAVQDPDLRQRLTEVISRYLSRVPSRPEADPSRVP